MGRVRAMIRARARVLKPPCRPGRRLARPYRRSGWNLSRTKPLGPSARLGRSKLGRMSPVDALCLTSVGFRPADRPETPSGRIPGSRSCTNRGHEPGPDRPGHARIDVVRLVTTIVPSRGTEPPPQSRRHGAADQPRETILAMIRAITCEPAAAAWTGAAGTAAAGTTGASGTTTGAGSGRGGEAGAAAAPRRWPPAASAAGPEAQAAITGASAAAAPTAAIRSRSWRRVIRWASR
jgi:hypothetical protein